MIRRSRADWLDYGLHVLAHSGVETLTIDAMCDHLKVTKGSFYHHFANREAFLEALLQYWEAHFTQGIITYSEEGRTPAERLYRLHERVIELHGTSEVAIRAWAQVDPLARAYQERVDQRRLDYLYQQYLALTGDVSYAQALAHTIYAILIGAQTIMPAYTREELQNVYTLLDKWIAAASRS